MVTFVRFRKYKYFTVLFFILSVHFVQGLNTDSLVRVLKTNCPETDRCKALLLLSENLPDGEWEKYNAQLLELSGRLIKQTPKIHRDYTTFLNYYAKALNNEGYKANFSGDLDNALRKFNTSLLIAKSTGDKKLTSQIYNNIGTIYQTQGRLAEALQYNFESLSIQNELGSKSDMAMTLNNIGTIYGHQSNIPKCIEYCSKSLKLMEETGDLAGAALCLNNLGTIHQKQNESSAAVNYYYKSLKLYEALNDKYGVALLLNNIAVISSRNNFMALAIFQHNNALKLFKEINYPEGIAQTLINIGDIYNKKSKTNEALKNYLKSYSIRESIGQQEGMATCLIRISEINIARNNNDTALKCLANAIRINESLESPEITGQIAQLMEIIESRKKNYKEAYKWNKLAIKMRDSLNTEAAQKATIHQKFQYEYATKTLADSLKTAENKKITDLRLKQEKSQRYILYTVLLLTIAFGGFIFNRYKTTMRQKVIIETKENETQEQYKIITTQKRVVEEKQKSILDSIEYAKLIQNTLFASRQLLNQMFPEHFLLFMPRDVVSGDFYWATKKNNSIYLAICDSTGHGVPGAFMSLLNIGFLKEAINEKQIESPAKIFDFVRKRLIDNISHSGQQDGFDGILFKITQIGDKTEIKYAAANNAPLLISNNITTCLPKDKMSVGYFGEQSAFSEHTIDASKGDWLFLYTDGYADQLGGENRKRLKHKNLVEQLLQHHQKPPQEQQELLKQYIQLWAGKNNGQTDDVCIFGFKI